MGAVERGGAADMWEFWKSYKDNAANASVRFGKSWDTNTNGPQETQSFAVPAR